MGRWSRRKITVFLCRKCGNIDLPDEVRYTGRCWHCGNEYGTVSA